MQGLFVCIIIVLSVAFLEIILGIIFKGVKWIVCFVLEYLLFAFVLFLILGKIKLLLSLVATIVLNIIVIFKKIKSRNEYDDSDYSSSNYVLNMRSGVIHDKWSPSAKTIKDNNKVEIPFYKANELANSEKKYRFKK